MNNSRNHSNGSVDKAWYCLEFYDPSFGHHSISVCFCTKPEANRLLGQADHLCPATTHIYYWRADSKPVAGPPGGYKEGPLAKQDT